MVRLEVLRLQYSLHAGLLFQFLVVRLEGQPLAMLLFAPHISIPCGTIRSIYSQPFGILILVFQFLVVRLEDYR